jgi:hypothetical protein
MSRATLARSLVAGLIAGLAGGMFGVGGGIVLIPLLVGWLGATQHEAHGTSLAVIGATALSAVPVYAFHHNIDWLTALVTGLASAAAAGVGARLAAKTSPRRLTQGFAVFLFLVAIRLLWHAASGSTRALAPGGVTVAFDLGLGVMVGLLSGFMGVGGGLVIVPVLVIWFGFSQQAAQGTSLAVILLGAPAGAFEHWRRGNVRLPLVPGLAIGAAAGSASAAWVAQGLPRELLTRLFALFVLANAIRSWQRAHRMSGSRSAEAPSRP